MPRIVHTLAEWRAISHELAATHTESAPPGLRERIQELIARAPHGWPEQPFALELDDSSAQALRVVVASLKDVDPNVGQRDASIAEAMQIIRDHQQRP